MIVCSTAPCHAAAESILVDMDSRVDSCEDFSAYACSFFAMLAVCSVAQVATLVEQIRKGARSPARGRINGAVQNSAEFATAFGCSNAAPMSPAKKCELW
ncbi:hypothetical protein BGZ70_005243 [Mortierella alpina]|uniref:Peptidase M13 C-terminal domain-containing protein n=1 Tax=Mortierella alpina TaxID=64518 RepID=A0A9P6M4E9_MORAP|nr:hypothetical protein BGZ70_005243 [Mortierella alpina]